MVMHISDDLFNRFLHLIGARMIDDELVMENDIEGVRPSISLSLLTVSKTNVENVETNSSLKLCYSSSWQMITLCTALAITRSSMS